MVPRRRVLRRVVTPPLGATGPERETPPDLLVELRARRVLGIVRGRDPHAARRALGVLVEAGVGLLEVSLTSTDALGVIEWGRGQFADAAFLGVGTVLGADDARRARDAGAQFAVSPGLGAGIKQAATLGLPVLPGALTPTEIIAGYALGASAVKVFPASLGGPVYLRALRDPLPHIPLVAVGGVGIDDIAAYLDAGAVGVGLGSPLLGDVIEGGDLGGLRQRARAVLRAVA